MIKKTFFTLLICLIISCNVAFANNQILKVGYWDEQSEVSQILLKQHPSLRITGGNMTADTTDELIGQFLTKEFTYDVFPLFSFQYDIDPLIEKGYLANLSGSNDICEITNKMRNDIISLVSKDAGIYALPYGLLTEFISIQPSSWYKAGLDNVSIPDTFDAFLDFLDAWCTKPVPGFCIINQFDETMYTENSYSKWLLELLFENYQMQYRYSDEMVLFDDIALKKKMERCIVTGKALYQTEKAPNKGLALFESGCSGIKVENLVSLRMNKEQPVLVKAYLWMVAVNADSSIQELAIDYAVHVLNENESISVLLYQEPHSVLNPYYNETLQEYQNMVNEIVEKLSNNNLSADVKLQLQNDLDEYRDILEEYRDKSKYYVTDVQVREFYDHVDGIFIEAPSPLSIGSENGALLDQLIASYAAGLLSTDQMVKKLNDICWMIQMEEGL